MGPASVLAYARRLAAFTSAPPLAKNRQLGESGALDLRALAQLPGARLPYPTEDLLKRGRLGMADSLLAEGPQIGETRDAMGVPSPDGQLAQPAAPPARPPVAHRPAPPPEDDEDAFDIDMDL